MVYCGVVSADSITIRSPRGGGGLTGGDPDPKRGRGLPWNIPHGGDLEGGGTDSQPPLHCRHHLPRIHPRIPGGSRYRDRHPRGQAAPKC